MFESKRVRGEVEALRKAIGIDSAADAFPIWYLKRKYRLSDERAQMQSSDPGHEGAEKGYDFGLDAYHIDLGDDGPRLALFQAKYSDALTTVGKAFKDLTRSVQIVQALVDGHIVQARENKVIGNLRADLNRLEPSIREQLSLEFTVLHLAEDDDEIIGLRLGKARDSLQEALEDAFPHRRWTIGQVGPRRMRFPDSLADVVSTPKEWLPLTLSTVGCSALHNGRDVEMSFGVGRLAELVEIYRARRDLLFSKNVRYFLSKKSNLERGPSGRMQETLKEICIDRTVEPELFAFFHNGITIYAEQMEQGEGGLRVRGPYVLNGCQTIKTAYLFQSNPRLKDRIDAERWQRITVPVRVTRARDEALIRTITINNNRQNTISPAALHANDPVQLDLQRRFQRFKIFYERQEGAFESLKDTNPDLLLDVYENTSNRSVNVVDLARSLSAVAGGSDLHTFAHHQNDIFESETAYSRCFSAKRLASVTLLVFLQNLYDVLPLVLKKDLSLAPADGAPKPARLTFYAMCLLCRYLAKEGRHDFVVEFGRALWGRNKTWRAQVASMCGNHKSHIKAALAERFMVLSDTSTESLKTAFSRAETTLKLGSGIEPFEAFRDLDDWDDDSEASSD